MNSSKNNWFLIVTLFILSGIFIKKFKKIYKKPFPHTSYSLSHAEKARNIVPLVIIGGGPAGLSAALYGARGKISTLVFQGTKAGGQLMGTSWVENWPGIPKSLGVDLIKGLRQQAEGFGANFTNQTITRVDFSTWPFTLWTDEGIQIKAFAVIIATGANPKKLGVAGEEEFWGKGVTTCAICDAPFYKDSDVVVIGGGDSAAEEAMQLAPYAKTIKVLVRADKMRASAQMQERLKEYPHISVLYNTSITAIKGDEKHVNTIEVITDGGKETWPIDGVFLAIGHFPNTALFKDQKKLKMDNEGYIELVDRSQATSIPGVFAAGDVADFHYRQAGVAAGDGIKAALDVAEFFRDLGINDAFMNKITTQIYDFEVTQQRQELLLIKDFTDLEREVITADKPVIIDFYTPFCPSCLQMLPFVEMIAHELKDKAKFVKIDALASQPLTKQLVVPTVPTLLIMKNGKEIARSQAVMNKQQLRDFIKENI